MLQLSRLFLVAIAMFSAPLNADPAQTVIKDRMVSGVVPQGVAERIEKVADAANFSGEAAFAGTDYVAAISIGPGNAKALSQRPAIWRWASVTKQIVSVMIMQEVAKGNIDLAKPVSTYLPTFRSANADKVSVEQLLRHQSGLPNPNNTATTADAFPAYYLANYTGSRDPLTGYCAGPPTGEPGGQWTYNNCDYIVAGALLEAVTGKSFAALFAERISGPFGLKTAGIFPSSKPTVKGRVGGQPEPAIDISSFGASAAVYGSIYDLLKLDRALINGRLLGPDALATLWNGKSELGYMALGQWAFSAKLKDCEKPVRLIERRGSVGGVQVRNFIMPEKKTAFVIFTDVSEDDFAFGEIWQGSGFSHDMLNAALCSPASTSKAAK